MENASKALIMAGTILISIMVISISVYIINMFGEFTSEQERQRENQEIAKFNAQFLKYEGRTDITAQDIITVANLAAANNAFYEFDATAHADEATLYVEVNVVGNARIEKLAEKESFLKIEDNVVLKNASGEVDRIKYYTCTSVEVSDITNRVYIINFRETP